MASNYTAGRYKAWDDNGNPYPTARLYTYVSGTTTHQAAFTDSTLATPCTYTSDGAGGLYIAMDARGEAQVWVGALVYTFTLKTPLGATIQAPDNGITDAALSNSVSLAAPGGLSLVGYLPPGTNVSATNGQAQLRKTRFLSNYVGAYPDGSANSRTALVNAISDTPDGGTLIIDGYYRIGGGAITLTKRMTFKGTDNRTGNAPNPALATSYLYVDADNLGFDIDGCVVTFEGLIVSGVGSGGPSTWPGIQSRNFNSSVTLRNVVVQSFLIGVKATLSHYCKFVDTTLTFNDIPLQLNNCYNAHGSGLTIRSSGVGSSYGAQLLDGSSLTMHGGSCEDQTFAGFYLAAGSNLNLFGTYFEGNGTASYGVNLGANCSVVAIGCHVYAGLQARWISRDSGSTLGCRIFSRNNRIQYPGDTTTCALYDFANNDPTTTVDISGDNWDIPSGVNTSYLHANVMSGAGPTVGNGNIQVVYPSNHPLTVKNICTIPLGFSPSNASIATPNSGTEVLWGCNGNAGDDPINLRLANGGAWGANQYLSVYQKGQYEKVGLRMTNIADTSGATLGALEATVNALKAALRAGGVMV